MDGLPGAGPGFWCVTHRFADAADLAHAVRGAGVEYLPLKSGRYSARLTIVGTEGLTIQRAEDRAHVARGAMDAGVVGFLFPLRQAAEATVNGRAVAAGTGHFLGTGAELHAHCPGDVDWASLTLSVDHAQALAEYGAWPASWSRPSVTLDVPAQAIAPLIQAVSSLTDLPAVLTEAMGQPQTGGRLAAGLWETLHAAFALAEEGGVPRATQRALRLVDAAEELLRANPANPLFTWELCAALGVSPRSLHKAFVAVTGMSPQAYLRRRRLAMVHAVLKAGGGDEGLVKSAALAHGFWHLGHFARAYRTQFGRTPSETLAEARPGTYRRAVARISDGAVARIGDGDVARTG